ncbi:hypothetical protein NMA510612_0437 [Neisseria meningitidis]|uniref:Uncharacterized protein n=1 Tax=Neisseria meningitidis TaxID=487 RepID=X5F4B0_NEIME|nr:hypothetical protein NMA510612_0437 [Neisseria meningitidis]
MAATVAKMPSENSFRRHFCRLGTLSGGKHFKNQPDVFV